MGEGTRTFDFMLVHTARSFREGGQSPCNRWHIPSRSRSTLDDVRFHAAPSLLTLDEGKGTPRTPHQNSLSVSPFSNPTAPLKILFTEILSSFPVRVPSCGSAAIPLAIKLLPWPRSPTGIEIAFSSVEEKPRGKFTGPRRR